MDRAQIIGALVRPGETPYTHTAGLWTFNDHPELILCAAPFKVASKILGVFIRLIREHGYQFSDGDVMENAPAGGGRKIYIRAVDPVRLHAYFSAAVRANGHDRFEALQIIMSDTEGRFPWDEGCSGTAADQPALYAPVDDEAADRRSA